MPRSLPRLPKRLLPRALELTGDAPALLGAAQAHAHEVPPCALRGVRMVLERAAPVQQRQVVDEVQVARQRGDLELRRGGDCLQGGEGGALGGAEFREGVRARVRGGAEERAGGEVDDEPRVEVVEDRAVVEGWAGGELAGVGEVGDWGETD